MFTFSKSINNKIANQNLFSAIFIMSYCILQSLILFILLCKIIFNLNEHSIEKTIILFIYIILTFAPLLEALVILILSIIGRVIFNNKNNSKAYRILMMFQHIFTIFPFSFTSILLSIFVFKNFSEKELILEIFPILCALISLCLAIFNIHQTFFEKVLNKPKKYNIQ